MIRTAAFNFTPGPGLGAAAPVPCRSAVARAATRSGWPESRSAEASLTRRQWQLDVHLPIPVNLVISHGVLGRGAMWLTSMTRTAMTQAVTTLTLTVTARRRPAA